MADNGKPTVTILYPEQHEQAAVALGRAFINDPSFKPVVREVADPVIRARLLAEIFRAMLAVERHHGQPVFGVVDNGQVVGVAATEGTSIVSVLSMMVTGIGQLPRMLRAAGWGGMLRGFNMMDVLARNHPKEPHLYLQALGVDPDFQKKHYGKALLERLRLEAAIRTDVAGVYLETATEANVAFYSAHGYEVIGELFPQGVRIWRMYQRKR
ncbi:MAG TPA: GNAT family N-acetyltransferase [Candidatus Binataceae bacterium]|nr:GNAT family N-acetyltransferase [Candidatus Binataceae bacterium]